MIGFLPIYKRELCAYFRTPVAYIFLVIFLLSSLGMTFFLGRFFDSDQASLQIFFGFHPWLYLILAPAIGMRLWAEERRQGTLEILMTFPVTIEACVLGKFLAGWSVLLICLALTFPLWLTVNYLGNPDNGVILTGYVGSALMAGAYLSIASLTSSLTRNQVVAFVLSVLICFVFVLLSWGVFSEAVSESFGVALADFIANLGFMQHFHLLAQGLLDTRSLVYFITFIAVFLLGTQFSLERIRAQ